MDGNRNPPSTVRVPSRRSSSNLALKSKNKKIKNNNKKYVERKRSVLDRF
jgi:FtsZ-binding cell division protein ZapB